jgi:ABC-type transporter Mla subunit MlaD
MEELFRSLPFITQVFLYSIFGLTFLMAVPPFYNERTASIGPTVLTMLGIFGCFFGIAIGLQGFQTTDVQGSVPALLYGIKTAFWASVAGIFCALLMKMRVLAFGMPGDATDGPAEGATVDDIARLLQRLNYSLAGKDDSTLLSQIKLMRQESGDALGTINSNLQDFLSRAVKNNADALIKALSEVIRDFNTKLTAQFGENFKQLNTAVHELVAWQENYRQQMAEMIELQKQSALNMSTASERYSKLVAQAESFSKTANSLHSLITTLELQREQVAGSLGALGNLLKEAGQGLPKIEEKILEMAKQTSAGVRASNEQTLETVKHVTNTLQTSITEMKKLLADAADGVHREVNSHIKQLTDNTKNQILVLDKALSDELSKSITTLGEHLTALSRKFVADYTPLTDKLRSLVQLAGKT